METPTNLLDEATNVLKENNRGSYTVPADQLYPHQWLWDSCFIAIGLSNLDPEKAKIEITSLLAGQWHNGMLPNIIFNKDLRYAADRNAWRSWINPYSPNNIETSGITQPPMIAEAVLRIGEKLTKAKQIEWYKQVFSKIVKYHQWLYTERDPHQEGLVILIHPWEVGMDNTPPWMRELNDHQLAYWIRIIKQSHLDNVISLFRRDTHSININQRFGNIEALAMYDIQRRLRRKSYDINRILDHSMFAIEDVGFNSILMRNNDCLIEIANKINKDLPKKLIESIEKTKVSFNELWDEETSNYYSRDFITHRLIKIPSAGSLLGLYAGNIPRDRAQKIIYQLNDPNSYNLAYPVPSTPINSNWYRADNYWQGPSWVNINWLLIEGMKRNSAVEMAQILRNKTLNMISAKGCYEYFNPENGQGLGVFNFSWTAALAIDLILNPIA